MAESKEISFAPWVLGVVAAVVVGAVGTVGSLLWNGNTQLTRQGAQLDNLANRISALEAIITSGAASRYTASDAARDRDAITALCAANARVMAETFDKIMEANRRVDERLRALEIWQAEFKGSHK